MAKFEFGNVVRVKAGGRHASRLPFALLADEGASVHGKDEYRFHALFMDRLSDPTEFGWANLYTSEIHATVTNGSPLLARCYLDRAREKGA